MQNIHKAIQAGYAAYRRGDYVEARRRLEQLDHPKALHLLGLVEKASGNLQSAAELLERASVADPNDHEIANSHGNIARQLGQTAKAEQAYRRALRLKPDYEPAGIGLGRVLIDSGRFSDARPVYERFLGVAPKSVGARYGYASIALATGDPEDAERRFGELIAEGADEPATRFMRARCRLELGRTQEAIEDLRASFDAQPSGLVLKTLAGILWMTGRSDAFESLLSSAAQRSELSVTVAEVYRQSGQTAKALALLEQWAAHGTASADAHWIAAVAYIDTGNAPAAEEAARRSLRADTTHDRARGTLVSALLMQGKTDEAITHIRSMREAQPDAQHWIAYEATALRLKRSPDYEALVDLNRFVRSYVLPTPEGFESLERFNELLLHALDKWHHYETHPLDQSLREGSQTPRSLTTIKHPAVQAYLRALDGPIRQYMQEMGTGGDHPLTRRNTGKYRISGCWSVRLHSGGRHLNHVHPEGWISSSYYVAVPEETQSSSDKAGWIKFGEPPFPTTPPCPPEKWICPRPGLLVLFPSFLWHGTAPIRDGAVRVTAPFDVVPA